MKVVEGAPAKASCGEEQRRLVRAFERRGGDCGDYQLHEHFESFADAGRGLAGEESGRARAASEAVGENQPRAGLESGDAIICKRRA